MFWSRTLTRKIDAERPVDDERARPTRTRRAPRRAAAARLWAQAIYEEYEGLHGILDPLSMSGRRRRPHDPRLHGLSLALFDRAVIGLPDHPLITP